MSEEELAAEIERQRTLNAARGGGSPRYSVNLLYSPKCLEGVFSEARVKLTTRYTQRRTLSL
jgi:hypothetical protein